MISGLCFTPGPEVGPVLVAWLHSSRLMLCGAVLRLGQRHSFGNLSYINFMLEPASNVSDISL